VPLLRILRQDSSFSRDHLLNDAHQGSDELVDVDLFTALGTDSDLARFNSDDAALVRPLRLSEVEPPLLRGCSLLVISNQLQH
jgi:hypothetical protein